MRLDRLHWRVHFLLMNSRCMLNMLGDGLGSVMVLGLLRLTFNDWLNLLNYRQMWISPLPNDPRRIDRILPMCLLTCSCT